MPVILIFELRNSVYCYSSSVKRRPTIFTKFFRTNSELTMDSLDIPRVECVENVELEIPASNDDWCGDDIFMSIQLVTS
jgi:hypothetical protein